MLNKEKINSMHKLLEEGILTCDEYVKVINSLYGESEENTIIEDCEQIITIVAEYYGMDMNEIKALSHSSININAKNIALYLCRKYTSISARVLSMLIGHCDHSTVIYAERKIEDEMADNEGLSKDILKMEKKIESNLAEKKILMHINNSLY